MENANQPTEENSLCVGTLIKFHTRIYIRNGYFWELIRVAFKTPSGIPQIWEHRTEYRPNGLTISAKIRWFELCRKDDTDWIVPDDWKRIE